MNITSLNPSNGRQLQTFVADAPAEIEQAVQTARHAQTAWAMKSIDERFTYFAALKAELAKQLPELVQLMLDETGNMQPDAEAEIYELIDAVDYYYAKARDTPCSEPLTLNSAAFPDSEAQVLLMPYGVIGLIMPWNFPFYSPMMYMIAALISGNAVVLKPSEYATLCGLRIQKVFCNAGFPADLVQVVIGAEETGKALVTASIDKLFFVGSVEAGRDIVAHAGIKPVHLEQGGNSAAIILEDADLEMAVAGVAWAGAYHAGQDCVGIKRVFVVEPVATVFLEHLVAAVTALQPGVDYGPYIRIAARDLVKRRIDMAVQQGAKLLCGGEVLDQGGFWMTPSVLTYTDATIQLVSHETFGNTIPVMVVKDTAEAIARANDTVYGLSNAIFSADITRAEKLAAQLDSGMVFINDPFVALPGWDHWVGWKDSGFGSPGSNIMHCLKQRVQTVNRTARPRDFWFPYPNK